MKIFIDTANLNEIKETLKRGFVRGITTNPSLLSKEPKGEFNAHIGKIIGLIREYQDGIHLSVEVFSKDQDEILRQAQNFASFRYEQLSVKVQVGWGELEAIKKLKTAGVSVNCTCCMSFSQAVMAAAAGARYVSLFVGRIRDSKEESNIDHGIFKEEAKKVFSSGALDLDDTDPFKVISAVRKILDESYPGVEIIAGSIRSVTDIRNAALAGAHIVTVPPKFFPQMVQHFKTDEVVNQFLTDFQNWMS